MSEELGGNFGPDPAMKNLYRLRASPLLILFVLISIGLFLFGPGISVSTLSVWAFFVIPTVFVYYWIEKYYDSITFKLAEGEVVVEKGVWFQKVHTVPYRLIMNVNTNQGPVERRFGLGNVAIETAGHSSPTQQTEASVFGIKNFREIKNRIVDKIRRMEKSPVGGEEGTEGTGEMILEELRKIRKMMGEMQDN